ncbi:MAG: hypothetical protein IKB27_05695 [Clostridia bacterium]|nr:hypothetical protein [Clostridia bacterium]
MKIDKKTIDAVLKMNDDQLWKTIQLVARKSGSTGFASMEKPKDMTKIRQTLASLSEDDINKAIDEFNRGKKK